MPVRIVPRGVSGSGVPGVIGMAQEVLTLSLVSVTLQLLHVASNLISLRMFEIKKDRPGAPGVNA